MAQLRQRIGSSGARVVALSALVLAVIAIAVLIASSGSTYTMKASFDDVRGVLPGSPVRAGAVKVGSIASVRLVGDTPTVTMKISKDFSLHEGATADIQLFSNAGAVNRTVELKQGDPTKPRLPEGTTMPTAQTDQPVNFDDASETLNAPTRKNIKRFLIGLDAALKGRGGDFDRSLHHSSEATNEVANLLAEVNSDGMALQTLVRQGSRVTSTLASHPGDLSAAADSTASLLHTTAGRQAEIGRSVQLLGPAVRRTRQSLATLADAAPRLRRLAKELDPVADELKPFARVLPKTLDNAGPFLNETRKLVQTGPGYLKRFRPIIDSARRVTPGLGALVRQVLPLGNSLRAYIPDTVGFFQNLGSSLGTYDANGHALSLTPALFNTPAPSTAAAEIGPDACTPGQLKAPYVRTPGALACQPWTDYTASAVGVKGGSR